MRSVISSSQQSVLLQADAHCVQRQGRPIYEAKGFITKDWVVIPDPGSEGGAIRLPGMVRAPRPASVS